MIRLSFTFLKLTSFLALISQANGLENDLIIETLSGKVQGGTRESSNGRKYYAFTGIPYAKPPVNELRFEPPEPADHWDGIFNASKNVMCPQFHFTSPKILGDEDCLVLNVYTPLLSVQNSTRKLPVMVSIHGGGYELGSGGDNIFGANILMNKDIVLVTLNYRLDALGFLSTNDDVLPGNYGMLDQVAALEWVQKNIANFGGDPTNVTIFGVSAGGSSVTHLVLSPKAKGLFHAAIAQSGSSMCNFAIQKFPRQNARLLAAKLRCPTHPSLALKNCVRNKTASEILTKTKEFDVIQFIPFVFTPIIGDSFLPDDPENLLKEKKNSKVPIIIGINEREGIGLYFSIQNYTGVHGENFLNEDLPLLAQYIFIGAEPKSKGIIDEYFKGIDANNNVTFRDTMIDVYSDNFASCVIEMVNLLVKYDMPVYVYRFIHRGNISLLGEHEYLGVDHGEDIPYFFNSNFFGNFSNLSETNEEMSNILVDLWTNFATYHDPTPNELENQIKTKWLPSLKNNPRYLDLDLNPTMVSGSPVNHTDFWIPEEKNL